MRTSLEGVRLSVLGLIIVTTISLIMGADYWQASIAGSLFAIWVVLMSGEEEK